MLRSALEQVFIASGGDGMIQNSVSRNQNQSVTRLSH